MLSVIMQGKCLIFNQSSKSCNTSFSLFFLEGLEDADFQEEDQEDEFPNLGTFGSLGGLHLYKPKTNGIYTRNLLAFIQEKNMLAFIQEGQFG